MGNIRESVGAIALDLILESGSLKDQLSNAVNGAMRGVGKTAGGGLTKGFAKLGAVVGSVFAVNQIVNFGKECINLGSDLAEVQNVVDVTFGSMNREINEFSQNAMTQFGLSETVAKKYAGTFGAMSKSFGIAIDQSVSMSKALTGLAGDVSSFYNISSDEAYTKLKAVYTGETESLKELGVVMTQTALDEFAYAKGMGKTTSKMAEREKVMLRYQFVLDKLNTASGDFMRTSDGWANQTRVLKLSFDALKASIGQGFINLLTPVIKSLNVLLSKLQVVAKAFVEFTAALMGKKVSISSGAGSAGDSLVDMGNSGAESAKKIKKAFAGVDEINQLQFNNTKGAGGGGGSIPDFKPEDMGNSKVSEEINKWTAALEKFKIMLQPTTDALKRLWNEGLAKLGNFAWGTLTDFYNSFLVPVGKWVMGTGLPRFFDITNALLNEINWERLRTSLDGLYKALTKFTTFVFDGLLDFYEYFLKPLSVWFMSEAIPQLSDILTEFVDGVDWESLNTSLEAFWKAIEPYAEEFGQGLIDFFKDASKIAVDVINKLPGFLDKFTDALNKGDSEDARKWGYNLIPFALGLEALKKGFTGFAIVGLGTKIFKLLSKDSGKIAKAGGALSKGGKSLAKGTKAFSMKSALEGQFVLAGFVGMCEGLNNEVEKASKLQAPIDFSKTMPQRQDFDNMTDYTAALDKFNTELGVLKTNAFDAYGLKIDGIEFDEAGMDTSFVSIGDKIKSWWSSSVIPLFTTKGYDTTKQNAVNGGEWMSSFLDSAKNWWDSNIVTFWDKHIAPWFTAAKWSELWQSVKTAFATKWEEIVSWWESSALCTWWTENVEPWFQAETWKTLWENVKAAFFEKWQEIVNWWNTSALVVWFNTYVVPWFTRERWIELWDTIQATAVEIFEKLKAKAIEIWTSITTKLAEFITKIKDEATEKFNLLTDNVKSAFDKVKTSVTTVLDGIKSKVSEIFGSLVNIVRGPINAIIDLVNKAIDGINGMGLKIPKFLTGGKNISFDIAHIPKLAQGGYVKANTPQLAIVGDNKRHGEITAPDNKMFEIMMQSLNSFFGNLQASTKSQSEPAFSGDIVIPIYLGNELVDERVITAQQIKTFRTGGR